MNPDPLTLAEAFGSDCGARIGVQYCRREVGHIGEHRTWEPPSPLVGVLLITIIASAFWFAVGLVIGVNWP